jgi:Reverse transcriptase (RNA-dependent DNA polymerase)
MNLLRYSHKPISSLASLAALLSIPQKQLCDISKSPDQFYKLSKNPKLLKNGKQRIAYIVRESLGIIQSRITERILNNVQFPTYLQGGIKSRDYVNNAKLHCGARIVIAEDIKNFFPTIEFEQVKRMWQYFFRFKPEIADLLARLTTYNGFVPQGAKTSTHIANIIFWDLEPKLVETLNSKGIAYSRFVDDVTISATKRLSEVEIGNIKNEIYSMFRKKGLMANRSKSKIMTNGKAMTVNGLNINSGKPTMPKNIRADIRSLVNNVGKQTAEDGFFSRKAFHSVSGKISNCERLHKSEMASYAQKLQSITKYEIIEMENNSII